MLEREGTVAYSLLQGEQTGGLLLDIFVTG